jgi:hypothetical protein
MMKKSIQEAAYALASALVIAFPVLSHIHDIDA